MLKRKHLYKLIQRALGRAPVVLLSGPRQSGKTTLARSLLSPESENYFDLEDPSSRARLEQPMTALRPLNGLVVIDEVQLCPDLFPILRVLADRSGHSARFLVLGSASGELLRQSSESLAGRVERVTISPLHLSEFGSAQEHLFWLRGGFPRALLADNDADSFAWRKQFMQTLLERDLPQWGVRIPASSLQRCWQLLAHYHGQICNAAEAARALAISEHSVRRYLDLLSDAFMLRQLRPYHANIRKRQVKTAKIYVRDSGLLHQLLGLASLKALLTHPKVGASWEGLVIEQILARADYQQAYFWATHQGAEIDLVLERNGELFGVECKRSDSPRISPSIRSALADLALKKVSIIYPGTQSYQLDERVRVIPLATLVDNVEQVF